MLHMAHCESFTPAMCHFLPCNVHVHQLGGGRKWLTQHRVRRQHGKSCQGRRVRSTTSALEEADWEEEMSLFRKRLQKPNQLETMRKIVEEVDLGKVGLGKSIASRALH